MKLLFSVNYGTAWGECVKVEIITTDDKARRKTRLANLETSNGTLWHGDIQIHDKNIRYFEYIYCIYRGEICVRREWNGVTRSFVADDMKSFQFSDFWKDIPFDSHVYSSAFTRCVAPTKTNSSIDSLTYFQQTLMFRVQAPQLKQGQALALIGSIPTLGDWNPALALKMSETGLHEWGITLSAAGLQFPFEYKYVIVDDVTNELISWEAGDNRNSPYHGIDQNHVYVISDTALRLPCDKWKGAGVVIPIFSLRSADSCGVGDFNDLKKMVDWAKKTGMNVIQLLPIYDTTLNYTWTDSYPYNSISIYALHPQYICLSKVGRVRDKAYMEAYKKQCDELNSLPQVDYEKMIQVKLEYLHRMYKQDGKQVLSSAAFTKFYNTNQSWLCPYAVFCHLRDKHKTADFHNWPELSEYHPDEIERLCSPSHIEFADIAFYFYVQFHLHCQLVDASNYARSQSIILKGDIPIGISRNSVEAWVEPHYFNEEGQTGAPPDDFSANGQNWGFPTYNWENMQKDGCLWWKKRFSKMAEYFDAYRIDHVLGFFRIWEIPTHAVHGLLGQFSPAKPMSIEEIESYGLVFRKDVFTKPYITDKVLDEIFGEMSEMVKKTYLTPIGRDWYEMKPEYDTQRKVEAVLGWQTDERNTLLREGLYSLISDVLFVPDRKDENMYHPRISAQKDYLYKTLSGAEREAFDKLYEHYYYHRHNEFWYHEAMRKLPMLMEATPMLVCAEDLGMVPDCVQWVMNDLKILTLEIQSMPKEFGVRFGHLEHNQYRSVSTIFTHDMPTLRGWWKEDTKRAQAYYSEILQKDGIAPTEMPGWLCEEVVARHLYSPSMLCLISWQDWLSINDELRYNDADFERINVPSNPKNYWHYRMHIPLEKLMKCTELNSKIKKMISNSGRLHS